jgi:succinylglutamate desuccinylase
MQIQKEKSIMELDSNMPWKTTTIMVGVHGNELSWVNAVFEILKDIKVISWKIYFIFANLKALEIWKRQLEKNMNRCFLKQNIGDTYEDQRVQEILPYLQQSDYLLDVHNTLNTWNSIPFLISEQKNLGKYFDVDFVISWFDNLHPGGSDSFMNTIWKIWLCLESGSIYDEKWPEIAKNWILNFLKFTWNISGKIIENNNQECIKFDNIYKNKTLNFKFVKDFLDFEKVSLWQIIAYDGEKEIISDRDWFIIFTYLPEKIWDECFCLWKNL